YLLIFGHAGFPELGIAGAGYATALAAWISALYGLFLVLKKRYESEYHMRSGWRPNGELMRRYLRFGLPSGMQWALAGLAFSVFLIIVVRMPNGTAALAATGNALSIRMRSVLPPVIVAQAVSLLVGLYVGEKKRQMVVNYAWSGLQISAVY